jgi:uncharacterized protein YjbI with pentapeptide repeats
MYYQKEYDKMEEATPSWVTSLKTKDIFEGNFNGCDLAEEDLSNAYLPYGKFYQGKLPRVQLQNAILNNSRFDYGDLSLSNLEEIAFFRRRTLAVLAMAVFLSPTMIPLPKKRV